jgi:hypothetical protein
MKLITKNNKVIALVTDDYTGDGIPTPLGFDESRPFDYVLVDGVVTDTNPPAVQARNAAKAQRQQAVDAIQVTTQSGKTFDGDETSQERMARAVTVAGLAGLTETTWVLANNVPTLVTLAELQEALVLAAQAQAELWVLP